MKILNIENLLPSDLPPGEEIVWFGRPSAVGLLRRAFRADFVAAYFVALAIWAGLSGSTTGALASLGGGVAALALLGLLAFLTARTTLYLITNRRVVIKVGVAMTVFHNLPYPKLQSAAYRGFGDGTGDIALKPAGDERVAYWSLWPCARPFHLRDPEPTLRAVPDGREVARVLTRAMIEANGGQGVAPAAARAPASPLAKPATA